MKVRNALLATPFVTTPNAMVEEVLASLAENVEGVGAVVDGGKLVGLISLTNILDHIVPYYADLKQSLADMLHETYFEEHLDRLSGVPVSELMARELTALEPDDTLIKAAVLMVEQKRRVLPVADADGTFVGLVSRRSLMSRVLEKKRG